MAELEAEYPWNFTKIGVHCVCWKDNCWPGLSACLGIEQRMLRSTVCSCHVTYAFQSESTLYICLNVKELLARSRREIWRWSDCNWSWTQNHLVLNEHSTIWPNWPMVECSFRTKWFWVRVQLQWWDHWRV